MNETEHKLRVLARIAEGFSAAGIVWAVGASLLLYFEGITDQFHDIDLMIALPDAHKADEILARLGEQQPGQIKPGYHTAHFSEFVVDGVEVDAMAGFCIFTGGKEYPCPFDQTHIARTILQDGVRIPLQSVDEWRGYYALMGREQKVKMIDDARQSEAEIRGDNEWNRS